MRREHTHVSAGNGTTSHGSSSRNVVTIPTELSRLYVKLYTYAYFYVCYESSNLEVMSGADSLSL